MTVSTTRKDRIAGAPAAPRCEKSRQYQQQSGIFAPSPAAGAHAAAHLVNEDATPGAGCLPSHGYSGREVDGAAG